MPNTIVSFVSTRARKVRGTDVKQGQTLYAVLNEETGLYFIWCYSDRAFAELMCGRVYPGDADDRAANWRARTDQLTASDRNSL